MTGERGRGKFRLPFSGPTERPFTPPRKALIVQPCCLGRVMLTTPLLAALANAFPEARFDWAVSDWARQAVSSNPRVTRLIHTGPGDMTGERDELNALLEAVRVEQYDTCIVPATHSIAGEALVKRADIPQRLALGAGGWRDRGVAPPRGERHLARIYLALAAAAGVSPAIIAAAQMEFHPPDRDRTAATRWLVEEFDWLGDAPLAILHPGGGANPSQTNFDKRWPAERFARLGNHLVRTHGARVVLVGLEDERPLAAQVAGMMSRSAAGHVANRAGQIGLGELGALCELASLYAGNDVGSTYIAAATGCPTLAIYGPTDPAVSAPYMVNGRVQALWQPYEGAFAWSNGVTVEVAAAAADELLAAYLAGPGLSGLAKGMSGVEGR